MNDYIKIDTAKEREKKLIEAFVNLELRKIKDLKILNSINLEKLLEFAIQNVYEQAELEQLK